MMHDCPFSDPSSSHFSYVNGSFTSDSMTDFGMFECVRSFVFGMTQLGLALYSTTGDGVCINSGDCDNSSDGVISTISSVVDI